MIVGAGSLKGYELWQQGNVALSSDALVAAGMAFGAALITIALLMAWLRRATFTPFAIYRVILGAALIGYSYGWVS